MSRAIVLAAVLAIASGTLAHGATERSVVAAPGSVLARAFATPVVPMQAANALTIVNGDITFHAIASDAVGSDDASWCGPRNPWPEGPGNPRRYPLGSCPLFWSDQAPPLGGARPVLGVGLVEAGRAYGFTCWVHPSMTGVVLT